MFRDSDKYSWLSVTVFCGVGYWSAFYKETISLIVEKINVLQWAPKFNLSDERHCIELEFKVLKEEEYQSAKVIDRLVVSFLKSLPESVEKDMPPYNAEPLFKPFDDQTVQYGIASVKTKKRDYLKIRKVTAANNESLLSQEFCYEDALLAYFCLVFFLIDQFQDEYSLSFFDEIIDKMKAEDKVVDESFFQNLYTDEKELFDTLALRIRQQDIDIVYPEFKIMKRLLNQLKLQFDSSDRGQKITNCLEIVRLVNDYMMFPNLVKWSILYAIVYANQYLHQEKLLIVN